MLTGKNLVLGVTGGIAAYKACELLREFKKRGAHVAVVMTRSAAKLVQPLTFQILSGNPVLLDLWESPSLALDFEPREGLPSGPVGHVDLGAFADAVVVAPATANILAKAAHGLADDALSTVLLAARGRRIFAPAMNVNMWNAPATQENLRALERHGALLVPPGEGMLACGWEGKGRMAEPREIADFVEGVLTGEAPPAGGNGAEDAPLAGRTVLVSAGPTEEPIDAVRYISNRSSGKMGYALAEAAAARGARVILISGPVNLAPPWGVETVAVRTAAEMREQVFAHLEDAGIVVKAAAVADFHLSKVPTQKVKKTAARWSLEFDPTPDILAELGRKKGDRLLIGFAAETQNLVAEARRKLESKNCDMIVANLVGGQEQGFESDENEVTLVLATGETLPLERAPKREVADRVFDQVLKLRLAQHAADGR